MTQIILVQIFPGIFFVIAGLVMRRYAPKEINRLFGYRTPRSMKSQEAWDFAQQYSARLLVIWGIVIILLGTLIAISPLRHMTLWLRLAPLALAVLAVILGTERALKNRV